MILSNEIAAVGKFQKTHALKGELNMISEIDPAYFEEGNPLIVEDDGIFVPFYVESIRKKGSTSYLVKLEGIEGEKEASEFVNKEIYILKTDAEKLLEHEIIEADSLIGYHVIDLNTNKDLGAITDIDDSTVNVLFIVKNENEEDIYIPAHDDLIEEIDDDLRKILMKIPEGLI